MTSDPTPAGFEPRRIKDAVRERLFGESVAPVRIGRFVVLDRLGMGGMGVVYSAYDDQLGRKVAIKLVREDRAGGERARERLRREAQAVAKLSHPNVVQVFDVGTHGDHVYVAMEFVAGTTLRRWLEAEPRDWRAIRDVFDQAAAGLAVAHDAGLVHRDFKPDNVMVGDSVGPGRVKVLDFGLAAHGELPPVTPIRIATSPDPTLPPVQPPPPRGSSHRPVGAPSPARRGLTGTGDLIGTVGFMAPEQHLRHRIDARSDQYAFCLSLAEAWLGARPFARPDGTMDLDAMQAETWSSDGRGGPLPASMVRLLRRGLSFDPDRRFADMHELRVALGADPRDRWRRAGLVALALAGVGAAGLAGYGRAGADPDSRCVAASERVEEIWNDARHGTVRKAVLDASPSMSLETWDDTVALIDDHLRRWSELHGATCRRETSGIDREGALRTRLCLESNLRALDGLLGRLAKGDASTVAFLPGNVETMPSATICIDPERAREQERRDEMLQTPLPSEAEGRVVSTFESSMTTRFGAGWRWFSDVRDAADRAPSMGRTSPGARGSGGALRIAGDLESSPEDAHWSGAIFYPGALPGDAVNFTAIEAVHFWARGGPGSFALAVFTRHRGTRPGYATFEVGERWQEYRIYLESIESQRYDVTGMFFGAYRPGPFELELDDVRIETGR